MIRNFNNLRKELQGYWYNKKISQTMQEKENFIAYSHYEYQAQLIKERTKEELADKAQPSFISKLNRSDVEEIASLLNDGSNIILSHTTPTPLANDLISTKFSEASLKNVRVLDTLEEINVYIQTQNKDEEILFISIFGLPELTYKPYLLKLLDKTESEGNETKKFIIYCQKIQSHKLSKVLSKSNSLKEFIEVELDVPTPYDYIVSQNLLEILEKFLHDQSKQVSKKDVVIFHAPTEQFKKKLFYLTKTKGFHLSTAIIYEGADSQLLNNKQLTKIFVQSNADSLIKQHYDLSSVYLILDYGEDTYHFFNYQRSCYMEVRGKFSYEEKCRRLNINLGNVGQYACSIGKTENREYMEEAEQRKYQDYGEYCLNMVNLGLAPILVSESKLVPEIGYCYESLKNSQIIQNDQISNKQILRLCSLGFNPILAQSILSSREEASKKSHLLLLTHSILTSPELRNRKQERLASIWHTTGYLESCLNIIIKCLQFSSQDSGISNTLITLDEIALNFQIDLEVFNFICHEYRKACQILQLQPFPWAELEEDDFNELLEDLITIFKPAVGTFSGSRRLGYLFKGSIRGFLNHRQSLISYYNEKPNFILATKMLIEPENDTPSIIACNYVRDDILISTYGCLPTLSKQSFGECQIQFHNISSAAFTHLSKFNGLQLEIFQKQNECSVEANSQLNAITIQCSKQKQKQINEKFAKVLKDIQQMFKKQTKYFKQSNMLKVVMSTGGQISELIVIQKGKSNEIMEMAVVKNLAPEVGIGELKELFDEFIQLKDIKMVEKSETNQAIVSFCSADDFRKFYQYFSGCVYYNHAMIVHPYVDETKEIQEENYLLFEWNVWKSVGEALVQFESTESARNALTNFKNLAGNKAKVEQKANMIFAEGLDHQVDEKQIESWVSGNGALLNLSVRRYAPTKELQENVSIKNIIDNAFMKDNIQSTPDKIVKGKNGHRSCKVLIPNKVEMNEVYFALNEVRGIVGNGKLYVTPVFAYPINLPEPNDTYEKVYRDIVKDFSLYLGRLQSLETELYKNPLKWTMIIKSNSEDEMLIIKGSLPERLKAVPLNINSKDSSIVFTQLALKNFEKLEKKLPVKIMPDIIEKKIKVLCKPSLLSLIEKQINTQIMESFVFQIPLYEKAYGFLQKNISQIVSQELKCGLKYRFEPINKNIHLEGNLFVLEKTRQKINKSLAQLKQKIQEDNGMSENICGLCCEEFKHPFKLQGCGHAFCFDCLYTSIKFVVQDITLYPIKCPQCMEKVWISDLNCLLQEKQWNQIVKTSINHFIFTHPGEFIFCMTAGCTFICNVKFKSSYNCPECKKGYCLSCRNLIHIGMSCHEARYGSDRLFNDYMSAVGARVCANRSCKAPIERISGCYKVQCSRCKKCMCFKCPANSMTPYDTPEETYNHMNRAHGGCF